MKETERRRGPNNRVKNHPARPDTRDRRVQAKNGGRNLKAKEIDSKPSSDKQNVNTLASELKTGAEPPEDFENMVMDYVDDAKKSEETLNGTRTLKVDEKHSNENVVNNSSNMGIPDESDAETANGSISSQGDLQTADEEKAEKVARVPDKFAKNSSDGYYPAAGSKSESKINNPQIKASKNTPNKGAKLEKGISMSTAKSSSDNFKNMKVHPKPQSDTWEGADVHPLEQVEGIDFLDEASNDAYSETSHDEAVDTMENNKQEDRCTLDQKIEEMEAQIENLQGELREVAALEIALYSVVPEHSSSAHKVHTPARRLSRLYIYACKYWSQNKRATVARNTVSGLVLVSKSCGNDVSRLTFWLSNAVVLREIISQAFGSSCHSSALAKAFESSGCETRFSPLKWNNTSGSRQLNNQGLLKFVDDWQETGTFTAALEKVESWIFSRIVESIWWQTLTPNMLSSVGDSITNKDAEKFLCPALGDQKQRNFSINLWRNAFHDALKRLCPVQAGGHECGCLPVLARKVMEKCIGRLDVAMFNAILRESVHEIPSDPVSDPIVESKVLPIPAGDLSFGSGAQLKNSVGNWARWLSEFLGKDADSLEKDETKSQDGDDKIGTEEPKCFPLLNALSDLLMLPKDMLMDRTIRMEVCPQISLPLVKRVLCNFSPDEFCPDPVPGAVLEALNAECIIERRSCGDSNSNFPYTAAPVVYTPPSPSDVAERVPDGGASSPSSRSASAQKGYASDEELDELESCLSCVFDKLPPSPTAVVNGNVNEETGDDHGRNARYGLLREVWQAT